MIDRTISPDVFDFESLSIRHPNEFFLDNGVRIVNLEMGEQPVTRLTVKWDNGRADCDSDVRFIMMYKLLREGTRSFSAEEISNTLEFNGTWLGVDPSDHSGAVSLYSLNSCFDKVFPTFMEIITAPAFPERAVALIGEKSAAAELLQHKKVSYLASRLDRSLIFGENHPMARRVNPDDYRDVTSSQIAELFARSIAANTPTVYICGQTAPILQNICEAFSALTFQGDPIKEKILPPVLSEERFKYQKLDGSLQSALNISIPTIPRSHPDYIPLRYAIMALGGYFGSRLMKNIREDKGYTYGISAYLLGFRETGQIIISTQTDNQYAVPVVEEVLKEIERLKTVPLNDNEMKAFRRHALSTLAGMLDSPFTVMDHFISLDTNNIAPDYYEEQFRIIKALNPDDISHVTSRYLRPDNIRISLAGHLTPGQISSLPSLLP